jgi:hypothetical protein
MLRAQVIVIVLLVAVPLLIVAAQAPQPPSGGAGGVPSGQQTTTPAPAPAARAAAPQRIEPVPGKPAEQVYKNIQALQGLPSDDLIPTMQVFANALGVNCLFCHQDFQHFEADTKDEKKMARQMIAMAKSINQQHFNGKIEVGCATCHHGANDPVNIPPLPDVDALRASAARAPASGQAGGAAAGQAATKGQQPGSAPAANAQPPRPSADEIFAKFTAAIGGQAAVDKLTTRQAQIAVTPLTGQPFTAQTVSKAPNKFLNVQGSQSLGFDGTHGWQRQGNQTRELAGRELEMTAAEAPFYRDLDPKKAYGQAVVRGRARVNGHDCWLVQARIPDNRGQDRLYYDVDSGLLVRRVAVTPTLYGPLAQTTDYDDYQEVNGVKVATAVKRYQGQNVYSGKVEVSFNAPVDDSKFAAPAPAPAQ